MLNIQGLMKQAQAMQKKMQEAQEKLAETEVNGTSRQWYGIRNSKRKIGDEKNYH